MAPEQAAHPAAAQQAPFVPKPAVPMSIAQRRARFEMEEAQKLLKKEVGARLVGDHWFGRVCTAAPGAGSHAGQYCSMCSEQLIHESTADSGLTGV